MWAAFVRQFAAYAITRRGKKLFALIGVLALCFGAALLIDMQFYVSASFAALLAGFSAMAYVVQHVKLKRAEHQRLLRKAEAARQRAIAAQARLERIDTAKSVGTRYGYRCGAPRHGQCQHGRQRGVADGKRNRQLGHTWHPDSHRRGRDYCAHGLAARCCEDGNRFKA